MRYGNQRRFSETANHSGPPGGGCYCTADRGDNIMKIKWDQVQSDAQFLYLMSVPGTITNIREAYSSYTKGDYADARQRSSRGLQATVAGGMIGLGLAYPGASFRIARTGGKIAGSPAGDIYRKIDFYNDLYKEYKKGDLEAKDFAFEMLPELTQAGMKRYTTYDESRPTKSYEVVASNATTSQGQKSLRTSSKKTVRAKPKSKAAAKAKGRCSYSYWNENTNKKIFCRKKMGHSGSHRFHTGN